MFGRNTGLWDERTRPLARAPSSVVESRERALSIVPQVGSRWRSFADIMADHENEQEEERAPAPTPPTRRAEPARSPRQQREDAVLLAAAARGWVAGPSGTQLLIRLNSEPLWRAVVRHLPDAELGVLAASLQNVRQHGTVQVEGP
jgi:hypothetical protein